LRLMSVRRPRVAMVPVKNALIAAASLGCALF
jgi:hypothetical protein